MEAKQKSFNSMKKLKSNLRIKSPGIKALKYPLAVVVGLSLFNVPQTMALPLSGKAKIHLVAEDRKVSGVVRDEKGEPMPGVTVALKGNTAIGTTSDINGAFQLIIPEGSLNNAVLVFSFIGYEAVEAEVGQKAQFDISLNSTVSQLDQVVVVGYSSKKVKYLSSSVATINNEKLRDVTSNELPNLLQGKAPGVVVSSASGDPTSAAAIVIRGAGTISAGTSPLYVVDGNIGGTYNPVDVESITVLKDVAATGLYGSRAANGVIIVTTKMGKAGKTRIDFNNTLGFAEATTGPFRMMNSQELYDYQKPFLDRDPSVLNTNTNWWDLAFRKAFVNNHNVAVSGGSDKTTYYVSGNYYKEQGTLIENDKTGYNFRANIQTQLSKRLQAKVLMNSRYNRDNYTNSNTLYDAYNNMPYDPAYEADGSPIDGRTYPGWYGRDRESFLHSIQYNYANAESLNFNTDLNLDYSITDNLTFSTYNRVVFNNGKSASYNDRRTKQGGANGGEIYNGSSSSRRLLTSNRLRYEKDFGKNNLAVIAVAEAENNFNDSFSAAGKGLPPGRDVMSVATEVLTNPTGDYFQSGFRKYLGQIDYSYDNRYFLVGSFVNEFSSLFGKNNSTANFVQFGASWILSNEEFLKNNSVLTFAKLRASHGTVGNADGISNFASLGLYSISQDASYGGLPGAAPSQKGNPNLTWEKIKSSNIGFDLSFFSRIDLAIDAYVKESSDLLYRQPLAATTGYSYVWVNAGSVRNKGIEFNLTSTNLKNRDFEWETNFNMAFNRNRVLELSDGASVFNPGGTQPIAVGHDMNEWNMPVWAGVNPENGDPQWERILKDADGNITGKELTSTYNQVQTADSRQFTGKSGTPKFTGGISNTLTYKNFTFSAFFNFVYGNYVYNNSRFYFDNDGGYESYNSMVLAKGWNRWEKPGDIATHPKSVVGGNKESNQTSTRYLEDGSYLRLRNIRLGYSLPDNILGKTGFSKLSVFVSADNLWTLTNFSGPDPEVDLSSGNSSLRYPISKKYLFGLNFSF